jgi:outer membrane protein OmpA-like peptidoglycan-associated protein
MQRIRRRQRALFASILFALLGFVSSAWADDHVRGVISKRATDGSVVVQSDDGTTLVITLDDATKIRQLEGARSNNTSSALLMPGLRIKASGNYESANRFAATRITFSRSDMKIAMAIQAGISPTDQRSVANQERIEEQARVLGQHGQAIDLGRQAIQTNSREIQAANQKIVATSGLVDSANARINNLDNYNVISTVTVYFANGRVDIAPKYRAQLEQLAAQAKGVDGYLVQVQGYASAVGSASLNQMLSMKRADGVTAILQQNGVSPTNVVVPAAMGTTGQVASNKTSKGQAENRRAVVTLLQNKGISNSNK